MSKVIQVALVNGTSTILPKEKLIPQNFAYSGPSAKTAIFLPHLKGYRLALVLVSRPGEIGGSGLGITGAFQLAQTVPLYCSHGDRVPLSVAMTMMGH